MLTAFAICYFISEISLSSLEVFNYGQGLIFLIILAAVIDFGIWTLEES